MSKDYELYEPYRDWDPFIERDDGAEKESDKRKEPKENYKESLTDQSTAKLLLMRV